VAPSKDMLSRKPGQEQAGHVDAGKNQEGKEVKEAQAGADGQKLPAVIDKIEEPKNKE